MTTTAYTPKKQTFSIRSFLAQALVILAGGLALFAFFVIAALIVFNAMYWGRIFPGVSVAGVDVSGLTVSEAEAKLNQVVTYPYDGKILLSDGDKVWVAAPVQMGMIFVPSSTARNALLLGRSGGVFTALSDQIQTLQSGKDVAPVMVLDERSAYEYIQSIAAQIDRPVVEAQLLIDGTNVTSTPGEIGRLVNVDMTLALVSNQMQTFSDGEVKLVIEERLPEVSDPSQAAAAARSILSQPLTLVLPNQVESNMGPWTVDPQQLASMLIVDKVPAGDAKTYQIGINQAALRPILTEIAGQVDHQPENARFIFNDDTRQIDLLKPAVIGYTIRMEESLAAINDAISQGQTQATLVADVHEPAVTSNDTAESLGITENVITYSTYFRGSSAARIQNIITASEKFHGLLIAPGETFSMGNTLGDVSLDNGYAEAMIIYDGRTIKGVGGGVCQVSTTLFRTAFFAGYPIDERYSHAYRVSYYEQADGRIDPTLSGLDATVYFPLVDFKFTNDTPYWILMETYVNEGAKRLTWKFYSTDDGRSVEWDTTGPVNVVQAPPPSFVENPDLPPGDMRQVDWSADGADVSVSRTVYRDGQVYLQDQFNTHYEAWQAVCEYNAVEDIYGTAEFRGICQ